LQAALKLRVYESVTQARQSLAKLTLESLEVERSSLLAVWPQGLCLDNRVIDRTSGHAVKKCSSGRQERKHIAGS
jgi:hypothetical protein